MVNAWSLAWEALYGTMDEEYPIIDTSVGAGNTAFNMGIDGHYEIDDDGLDYEVNLYDGSSADYYDDYMADVDEQRAHHFKTGNVELNYQPQHAHFYKYHEEEILKDIEEYVSQTYQGHYTGKSHEYRNVQTIDLMASKELAAAFCQANILKYGSRYGNKDGKNKKDLMKVIHYAMLLLHFDNHYGEPSMPSGNFEQMP